MGKSTLFNRLLGRRQAIEHVTAGTTRDVVRGILWFQSTRQQTPSPPVRVRDSREDQSQLQLKQDGCHQGRACRAPQEAARAFYEYLSAAVSE